MRKETLQSALENAAQCSVQQRGKKCWVNSAGGRSPTLTEITDTDQRWSILHQQLVRPLQVLDRPGPVQSRFSSDLDGPLSWGGNQRWHITYLWAATARLFRYFWAVMTPTKRKLLEAEPGCSVAGEPLSCADHSPPPPPTSPFSPQPAGFAFRFCPAFFSSVALGKMSLEASVNPTTSPSRTLNQALRLRPAIPPKNFPGSPSVLTRSWATPDEEKKKRNSNTKRLGAAHTHSLMVEMPLSFSCLRSITAVRSKPPPEPFAAAAPADDHQVVRRGNVSAVQQTQSRFFLALNSRPILAIISPLTECRTAEVAGCEGFNGDLTQRNFRSSAVTGRADGSVRPGDAAFTSHGENWHLWQTSVCRWYCFTNTYY